MRKSKLKFLIISLILLLIMQPVAASASANILDWYLVDSGKKLDWINQSDYRHHVVGAMDVWNGHKSGVIREDTWKTVRDVLVLNMYKDNNIRGETSPNGYIRLNQFHLNGEPWIASRSTVIHEFGHALGIDHTPGSMDVMYKKGNSATYLRPNDKSSYNKSYKRY